MHLSFMSANMLGLPQVTTLIFNDWRICKDTWVDIGKEIERQIQDKIKKTPMPEIWKDAADKALEGLDD